MCMLLQRLQQQQSTPGVTATAAPASGPTAAPALGFREERNAMLKRYASGGGYQRPARIGFAQRLSQIQQRPRTSAADRLYNDRFQQVEAQRKALESQQAAFEAQKNANPFQQKLLPGERISAPEQDYTMNRYGD